MKGCIILDEIKEIKKIEGPTKRSYFEVVTEGRTYIIRAVDPKERDEWIRILTLKTLKHTPLTKGLSSNRFSTI